MLKQCSKEAIIAQLRRIADRFSGDWRTHVGAGTFINGRFVWGVNALGTSVPEEDEKQRTNLYYTCMIHAEIDMCSKVRLSESLVGNTVFVTLFPCEHCAGTLAKAGVKHIVAGSARPQYEYEQRARKLLDEAGVTYEVLG